MEGKHFSPYKSSQSWKSLCKTLILHWRLLHYWCTIFPYSKCTVNKNISKKHVYMELKAKLKCLNAILMTTMLIGWNFLLSLSLSTKKKWTPLIGWFATEQRLFFFWLLVFGTVYFLPLSPHSSSSLSSYVFLSTVFSSHFPWPGFKIRHLDLHKSF